MNRELMAAAVVSGDLSTIYGDDAVRLTYLGSNWMCRNTRFKYEEWIAWMQQVIV